MGWKMVGWVPDHIKRYPGLHFDFWKTNARHVSLFYVTKPTWQFLRHAMLRGLRELFSFVCIFFSFPYYFPPFVLFWGIDLDWLIRMFWYSSSSLELQRQHRAQDSRRVPLVCLLVCGGSSLFRSSLFSDCPLVCPWKSLGSSIRWSVADTVDPSLTPP